MIREAMDRLIELAAPNIHEELGITYSDKKLIAVDAVRRAEPFEICTLSGLAQYIKDVKEVDPHDYIVHVRDPRTVVMMSELDADRKRETLIKAYVPRPIFEFGRYQSVEAFTIGVQSMFVDDNKTDKALVLKFSGSVTAGSVTSYKDDGVTQKATIKQGVASKTEAIIPSPCKLKPYRTFTEVDQPASDFIFRMREGSSGSVEAALFEADGGAWKNEAMNNIKEYLEKELSETGCVVIA